MYIIYTCVFVCVIYPCEGAVRNIYIVDVVSNPKRGWEQDIYKPERPQCCKTFSYQKLTFKQTMFELKNEHDGHQLSINTENGTFGNSSRNL